VRRLLLATAAAADVYRPTLGMSIHPSVLPTRRLSVGVAAVLGAFLAAAHRPTSALNYQLHRVLMDERMPGSVCALSAQQAT